MHRRAGARQQLCRPLEITAAVAGLLQSAARGTPQLVFVTGEPGIGKTALLDQFSAAVGAKHDVLCSIGRCIEGYGGVEPYYPMLEALTRLARGRPGDSLVQSLVAIAPSWAVQLPGVLARETLAGLGKQTAGSARPRMVREFCEWVEEFAATRLLVFILEDPLWSDYPTGRFAFGAGTTWQPREAPGRRDLSAGRGRGTSTSHRRLEPRTGTAETLSRGEPRAAQRGGCHGVCRRVGWQARAAATGAGDCRAVGRESTSIGAIFDDLVERSRSRARPPVGSCRWPSSGSDSRCPAPSTNSSRPGSSGWPPSAPAAGDRQRRGYRVRGSNDRAGRRVGCADVRGQLRGVCHDAARSSIGPK